MLPDNVTLSKDARIAFQRAAGIFIFYLTHCTNDIAKDRKRSTLYSSDVVSAIKELGFAEFETPLMEFLEKYRAELESKKEKKLYEATAQAGNTDGDNSSSKASMAVDQVDSRTEMEGEDEEAEETDGEEEAGPDVDEDEAEERAPDEEAVPESETMATADERPVLEDEPMAAAEEDS